MSTEKTQSIYISKTVQSVYIENFGERLRKAFKGANNTQIAKVLGVSKAAMTNYIEGKVTLPVVMEVSEKTGYSIDWLLTGKGLKYLNPTGKVSLDKIIEERMRQIAKEELQMFIEGKFEPNSAEKYQITQEEINEIEFDEKIRKSNQGSKNEEIKVG